MFQKLDDHRRALVALLFAVLVIIGVLMLPLRTSGGDESVENKTLSINIKAYADLLLPEDSALRQELAELESIDEWQDREYGQARSYWIWPLMQLADTRTGQQALYHFHIYLTFLLGLYAAYRIVWRLTGRWQWGLVSAGLLGINPRLFAQAFCNNKDIMLLAICLLLFWLGLRFAERDDWLSCVWFGIAGAFAINTRMIGLGAFGLMGLFYLAFLTVHRRWSRKAFLRGALAVAVCLLVFWLITPACWHNFLEFWQFYLGSSSNFSAERWNGWVLYRGAVYNPTENPVPWHYIPWFMAITTPLLTLGLAVLWPVLALLRCGRSREKWLSLEMLFCYALCLFAGLPLLYAMLVRPNLYNGWRHFYFIYGTVAVLAAMSAFWLWQSRAKWLRPVLGAALALNLVYYAGVIGTAYPDEYAYFNFLAGEHPEESYDADYWYLALPRVIEDIQQMDPDARVCDASYRHLLRERWYAVRDEQPELFSEKAEEISWDRRWRARYVLVNTSYWKIDQLHMNCSEEELAQMQTWISELETAPVVREWSSGRTVLWRLYENPEYNG